MKGKILTTLLLLLWASAGFSQKLPESPYREPPALRVASFQPLHFPLLPPPTDTVTLFIMGDLMSHGSVIRGAEEHGYQGFFKHIEDRIQGADIAIGNMEFPLAGPPFTGYPAFSGPEAFVDYLSEVGFDVFLTANNHVLDKGSAGLRRTIRVLEEKGLLYTGIAANEAADTLLTPLMLQVRGLRIALLNFTYGSNYGADSYWPKVNRLREAEMAPALERARRQADIVLVFPHWGIEYQLRHSPEQEATARWLLAHGADAVIGTHPHVIQDWEVLDGIPVIYSLGNGISNQNDLPARLEAVLTLRIVREPGAEPRLLEPSFDYLWCTKPGMIEATHSAVPVTLPREYWNDPADYRHMMETLNAQYEKNPLPGSHRPH